MEESVSFFKEAFRLKDVDAGQYSPLVLAYIGDAVYEIIIRTIVVNRGNAPVKWLHRQSAGLVKAAAQARLILLIEEELTPEEHDDGKKCHHERLQEGDGLRSPDRLFVSERAV